MFTDIFKQMILLRFSIFGTGTVWILLFGSTWKFPDRITSGWFLVIQGGPRVKNRNYLQGGPKVTKVKWWNTRWSFSIKFSLMAQTKTLGTRASISDCDMCKCWLFLAFSNNANTTLCYQWFCFLKLSVVLVI